MKASKLCGILLVLGLLLSLTLVPAPIIAEGWDDGEDPPWLELPKPISDMSESVPDSCPLANLLNPASPKYNPSLHNLGRGTRFDPNFKGSVVLNDEDQQWVGTDIDGGQYVKGVMARQTTLDTIELDGEEEWLYAPTLRCPNHCPIEVVTLYHEENGEMVYLWTIYDHEKPGWQTAIEIDRSDSQAWRKYNLFAKYNVEILWDYKKQKWCALLYNFYTNKWEEKYSTSESTEDDDGFNIWEEYHFTDDGHYPQLKTIRSRDLQVYIVDGSPDWYEVTDTYGGPRVSTEVDFPYNWEFVDEYYYWKVNGEY